METAVIISLCAMGVAVFMILAMLSFYSYADTKRITMHSRIRQEAIEIISEYANYLIDVRLYNMNLSYYGTYLRPYEDTYDVLPYSDFRNWENYDVYDMFYPEYREMLRSFIEDPKRIRTVKYREV